MTLSGWSLGVERPGESATILREGMVTIEAGDGVRWKGNHFALPPELTAGIEFHSDDVPPWWAIAAFWAAVAPYVIAALDTDRKPS